MNLLIEINGGAPVVIGFEVNEIGTASLSVMLHRDAEGYSAEAFAGGTKVEEGATARVRWFDAALKVGDEVKLKIVENEPIAACVPLAEITKEMEERSQYQHYLALKKKFEPKD